MVRVYDTNALWRNDEIIRIQHLEAEIADMQKDIDRQKQKAVAAIFTSGLLEVETSSWCGHRPTVYPLPLPLPKERKAYFTTK